VTGLAIVDAILAGHRDSAELAKLRDPHIKADPETIRKSLEGNWRPEHLFTLGQSRDLYRIYQQQIVNCNLEIEKMLSEFEPGIDPTENHYHPTGNEIEAEETASPSRIRPTYRNLKLFRVDVTQIPGLEENALPLFSEVRRDMSWWPTAAHLVS
jgi:transposase